MSEINWNSKPAGEERRESTQAGRRQLGTSEGNEAMPEQRRQNIPEAVNRLGHRVRELRKRASLTQEELAERAGISVSFLSMIERGDRVPHIETLVMLGQALHVSLPEMFLGFGEPVKGSTGRLRPLIDYLERQDLDASDVEALLVIAKTLYRDKGG
jgi:transcriptional regulator with XRE-family HTH domain